MEYIIQDTKTTAGTRLQWIFIPRQERNAHVAMHWEHRFRSMLGRYNEIYKVQMPKITPYVCRHTYCSNMAKSGINPKTLQYLMGHSDIAATLNVYTHVGLEDAEKELQKMQGLENARKEMEISDTDDKPLKQNMFKVV